MNTEIKLSTKEQANEFIKLANVAGLVYANEGGVIYLEDILIDFVKWYNKNNKSLL